MYKILLFTLLLPIIGYTQIQIGQDINSEATGDRFGRNISISSDGGTIAIGARTNDGNGINSGHVRVYENIGGVWTQIGQDIDGEAANDQSGTVSISSDGNIVAIGAKFNDGNGNNSGHVRIYENIGGVWTQIGQDINGENEDNSSGVSVSISSDGSIVAIGANGNSENGFNSGHVRVYENTGGTWTKINQDIDGETNDDNSGYSASISSDGSIVAIGAPGNEQNGILSGQVRVYENIRGIWTQIGQDIFGEAAGDRLGYSVSISSDGSIVAIGAPGNDQNGEDSGHVRIYKNIGTTWTQIGQDINGEAAIDYLGSNLSISSNGSIVAIGAPGNDENGNESGHVRIYKNIEGVWTQIGQDLNGESAESILSNVSISSDGSIIAIGEIGNDENGILSGQVRVYDLNIVLSSDEFVFSKFNLYPSPAKNEFTIQLSNNLELTKVNIYNNLGQIIYSTTKNVITTSAFSTGIYFVELITNKGKTTKRLLIE